MKRWLLLLALGGLVACEKKAPGDPNKVSIDVKAKSDGFDPSSVRLNKGAQAVLVFTRTTDETCAKSVIFPELNIKKELPKDKPVEIEIPTTEARTLTFMCGMEMYKSSVVIQ
ncbi:MAG: cupredoxin domain-containing protein [Labilithrix sp.]|nr:cupredoxin domain-containing protein [Labilithrix sp.]MCW5814572.1 cupredoxin domain-containing protein [Labilithrix sp.]